MIHRFDAGVTDTPDHVHPTMKHPSCGVAATEFGVHNWARPITDGGSGILFKCRPQCKFF